MHDITTDGFGLLADAAPADLAIADLNGPHRAWEDFINQAAGALPKLVSVGIIKDDLAKMTLQILDDHSRDTSFVGPGVLLHGDSKLPHVFAARGTFVGIIDWVM